MVKSNSSDSAPPSPETDAKSGEGGADELESPPEKRPKRSAAAIARFKLDDCELSYGEMNFIRDIEHPAISIMAHLKEHEIV